MAQRSAALGGILIPILCFFCRSSLFAQDPKFECGAEDHPRVGFAVHYTKWLPNGYWEEGPETDVGRWGGSFLPDVSGGPVLWQIFLLEPPAQHYLLVQVFVEENWTQARAAMAGILGLPPGDDVGVTVEVSRMQPGGVYRMVRQQTFWVATLSRVEELKDQVLKELSYELLRLVGGPLLPKHLTYHLMSHVYDVEEPLAPYFFVETMEDAFGPIEPHAFQRLFCFNLRFQYEDGLEEPSPRAVHEQKFWRYDLEPVLLEQAKTACEPKEGYCRRPVARLVPYLTKAFGLYYDELLEEVGAYDDRPITFLCPLSIEPPEPDTLRLGAPEETPLRFRLKGLDGAPLPGVDLEVVRTVSGEFGQVGPNRLRTNTFGETADLRVRTREDAPDGKVDAVVVAACRNTPPSALGKDEYGRPIPWKDEAEQILKIQNLPVVEMIIRASHRLERWEDLRIERREQVSQKLTRVEADQSVELRFRVPFREREVRKGYRDGSGFRGTLLEYRGYAAADLRLGSLEPFSETVRETGYYQDSDCGRLPFDFESWSNRASLRLLLPRVDLAVTYRHYIPDEDSPVQNHPREGLSFVQRFPTPALTFTLRSTSTDMEQEGCRLEYVTARAPAMAVPIPVSEAFLSFFMPDLDDCYGFEAVTVPLKEEGDGAAFLRKWDPVIGRFDTLERTMDVHLTRNQAAECWDLPPDSRDSRYLPQNTFVRARLSFSSRAELVGGRFSFLVDR